MQIGVTIGTRDRPEYLDRCLTSLKKAINVAQINGIHVDVILVDNGSTNPQTLNLIQQSGYEYWLNQYCSGYKIEICRGCDMMLDRYNIAMNLDADAIIRSDFFVRVLDIFHQFPNHIITGFNCKSHKIIEQGNNWCKKSSAGGINLLFSRDTYYKWIRPFLISHQEPWDVFATQKATRDGFPVICTVPSIVQHIGLQSLLGHYHPDGTVDIADDYIDL